LIGASENLGLQNFSAHGGWGGLYHFRRQIFLASKRLSEQALYTTKKLPKGAQIIVIDQESELEGITQAASNEKVDPPKWLPIGAAFWSFAKKRPDLKKKPCS
jgi:hypothetical protein